MDRISNLPENVVHVIFSWLPSPDLLRLCFVSRTFTRLVLEYDGVAFTEDFPETDALLFPSGDQTYFQDSYPPPLDSLLPRDDDLLSLDFLEYDESPERPADGVGRTEDSLAAPPPAGLEDTATSLHGHPQEKHKSDEEESEEDAKSVAIPKPATEVAPEEEGDGEESRDEKRSPRSPRSTTPPKPTTVTDLQDLPSLSNMRIAFFYAEQAAKHWEGRLTRYNVPMFTANVLRLTAERFASNPQLSNRWLALRDMKDVFVHVVAPLAEPYRPSLRLLLCTECPKKVPKKELRWWHFVELVQHYYTKHQPRSELVVIWGRPCPPTGKIFRPAHVVEQFFDPDVLDEQEKSLKRINRIGGTREPPPGSLKKEDYLQCLSFGEKVSIVVKYCVEAWSAVVDYPDLTSAIRVQYVITHAVKRYQMEFKSDLAFEMFMEAVTAGQGLKLLRHCTELKCHGCLKPIRGYGQPPPDDPRMREHSFVSLLHHFKEKHFGAVVDYKTNLDWTRQMVRMPHGRVIANLMPPEHPLRELLSGAFAWALSDSNENGQGKPKKTRGSQIRGRARAPGRRESDAAPFNSTHRPQGSGDDFHARGHFMQKYFDGRRADRHPDGAPLDYGTPESQRPRSQTSRQTDGEQHLRSGSPIARSAPPKEYNSSRYPNNYHMDNQDSRGSRRTERSPTHPSPARQILREKTNPPVYLPRNLAPVRDCEDTRPYLRPKSPTPSYRENSPPRRSAHPRYSHSPSRASRQGATVKHSSGRQDSPTIHTRGRTRSPSRTSPRSRYRSRSPYQSRTRPRSPNYARNTYQSNRSYGAPPRAPSPAHYTRPHAPRQQEHHEHEATYRSTTPRGRSSARTPEPRNERTPTPPSPFYRQEPVRKTYRSPSPPRSYRRYSPRHESGGPNWRRGHEEGSRRREEYGNLRTRRY